VRPEGQTDVVGNLDGLYKLSQIDLEGARTSFGDVVKTYPDFTPAKINLARVMLMLGNRDQAEGILSGILAKQPAAEPALTLLVSSYAQSNRAADATALLERAHRSDPALTRVTLSLGSVYIRLGEPRKAMDLASEAKGPAAASVDMLSLQAAAYLALGQKKAAGEVYESILKQDPNIVGARRQLVSVLIDAGDFEAARNTVTAGIAANPRNYQLY